MSRRITFEESLGAREMNIMSKADRRIRDKTINRFEVIDHTTSNSLRALVRHGVSVELLYQDDGRTLKVVLRDTNNES
jgi:hypothetical protein